MSIGRSRGNRCDDAGNTETRANTRQSSADTDSEPRMHKTTCLISRVRANAIGESWCILWRGAATVCHARMPALLVACCRAAAAPLTFLPDAADWDGALR